MTTADVKYRSLFLTALVTDIQTEEINLQLVLISKKIRSYQLFFGGLSIFISACFLLLAVFNWNGSYFAIVLVVTTLLSVANLFSLKFSEVVVERNTIVISSLFRPPVKINATLFDKVTEMNVVIFMPALPYYNIYFKDGTKFHFIARESEDFMFPFRDKKRLAKELTERIEKELIK